MRQGRRAANPKIQIVGRPVPLLLRGDSAERTIKNAGKKMDFTDDAGQRLEDHQRFAATTASFAYSLGRQSV